MRRDDLKPCPFCGGKAKMHRGTPDGYYVACSVGGWECGVELHTYRGRLEVDAAGMWNRRASAALSIEQTQPVADEPVAWRYKFKSGNWTVQKNKPDWYKNGVPDCELEPLYAHPTVSALVNAQADADVVGIPAEPTDEMIEAGEEEIASRRSLGCRVYAADIWAAMISSLRPAEVGSATTSKGQADA